MFIRAQDGKIYNSDDLYMFEVVEREAERPDQGDVDFWSLRGRHLHLAEATRSKSNFRERDVDGIELARYLNAEAAEIAMQQIMLAEGNLDLTEEK